MAEAIRIARQELRKYVNDPDTWRLVGVELRAIGTQSKWYYEIEWNPPDIDHVGDGISIPVLMTGNVVEVKVEADTADDQPLPPS